MPLIPILLLILTGAIALYDGRTRRVPNPVTLPLLAAGLALHFPGSPALWAGTLVLFAAWHGGGLGGGDAKLWMALLWLAPPEAGSGPALVMGLVLIGTALAQLAWRALRGRRVLGVRSPGAWRAIPFAVWLLFI